MVNDALSRLALPLFVPADRPDRYAKAFASGSDAVILDLEDAVAPDRKTAGRQALLEAATAIGSAGVTVLVRVNPAGTPWHADDLAVAARLPVAGLVLPKVETEGMIDAALQAFGRLVPVLAMVESARGLGAVRSIAAACARLAFGSHDFAADLGCAHEPEPLLAARCELVLASRLAGLAGPVDGVTTAYAEPALVEADAARAAALGCAGKLLIHPAQVAPAARGFAPSARDLAWAERILAGPADGAAAVGGTMVDAPVRLRAEQILRRAAAFGGRA